VSFGHGEARNWEDAHKYGFISAGHGRWYLNTLNMINTGYCIGVNIPKTGYLGIGKVTGDITRAEAYPFKHHDNKTLAELDTKGSYKNVAELMTLQLNI